MEFNFRKIRSVLITVALDLCSVAASVVFSLLLTTNSVHFETLTYVWMAYNMVLLVGFFTLFRLYKIIFYSAGLLEIIGISVVNLILLSINLIFSSIDNIIFTGGGNISISQAIIFDLLVMLFTSATRFSKRIMRSLQYYFNPAANGGIRAMIIGGGMAGTALIHEMQTTKKIKYMPVCVIDDDECKLGKTISGVRVVGTRNDIVEMAKKYQVEEILIAIPSAGRKQIRGIVELCEQCNCKVKTLPGTYQLVSGDASVADLKEIEITDLLGRDQVEVNLDEIMGYIEGQVVLVTGGGGSIGSELCRQIASHNPKKLIIFDIYENNAYDIQQELIRRYPYLNLLTLIASVRDKVKVEDVFKKYRPDIVFNAAAHKHVPLMETSPNEAVKNNVFGTLNVAKMADKYSAKTFVQISTDKAVNPTSVMGATKRICEMIIQTIGRRSEHTNFVAVRFGNVLGSNGSVIPLFRQQIKEGGPVTVTHKDIIRYFMTIPEAVSLVLQAGAYAKGGQIFVLDMGEPVKIYDLAVNLIKLSGLEPNVDIEIKCTGLRPGEKLYEERLMDEEGMQTTPNGLINIASPIDIDEGFLWLMLDKLGKAAQSETAEMKTLVSELVPTYKVDDRT